MTKDGKITGCQSTAAPNCIDSIFAPCTSVDLRHSPHILMPFLGPRSRYRSIARPMCWKPAHFSLHWESACDVALAKTDVPSPFRFLGLNQSKTSIKKSCMMRSWG